MQWFLSVYIPSAAESEEYWKDVFSIFLDSVACFDDGRVAIHFNLFDNDPKPHSKLDNPSQWLAAEEDTENRVGDTHAYEENASN